MLDKHTETEETSQNNANSETDLKKSQSKQIILINELYQNRKLLDKRILMLAWPTLVELLMVTLFGMIDMIMVGNVNTQSLAAVGLSNQPILLTLAIFQALNVGSTALVARFIGAGQSEMAKAVARQTLILILILGICISFLGVILSKYVIILMGAEPDVIPLATIYFRIVAMGGIFAAISMGITAVLRGAGDTLTPMRFNIVSNLFNVFGNYVLIYGKLGFPAMGVAGAALSTTIARGLASGMALYAIFKPNSPLHISLKDKYTFNKDLIQRILKIGFPSALEQLFLRTGQLVFVMTVASLGTTVIAAHQVAMNIFSLSFAPGQAFGAAATTLVGQSLGSQNPELAERCGYETRRLGMYVAISIAAAFFLFGPQIAGIYSNDPAVISLAAMALKIIAVIQPMQSTQFILAGALRGAGDTKWPLYSTFIGIWGFRVLFAWIFIRAGLGLAGAWMGQGCDQIFRSIFIYTRYRSGNWKKLRV